MAIHGLQIVSPSGGRVEAGIDEAGPDATPGGMITGKGGGPAAETGLGIAGVKVGSGGGFAPEEGVEDSEADGAADFSTGSIAAFSTGVSVAALFGADSGPAFSMGAAAGGSELVLGIDSRNSGIGCQADFDSLQARSAALKLPSAIFSRMADSEKRPANCPFR